MISACAIRACLSLFSPVAAVLAQDLSVEVREKSQDLVAVLSPAQRLTLGKSALLECDLTQTSRELTERELSGVDPVLLGPVKRGTHLAILRGEKATYTQLLILDLPKKEPPVLASAACAMPALNEKTAPYWRKYWAALDADVLKMTAKRSIGPVATKAALKAPVLLIACGASLELPPLAFICNAQGKDLAIDIAIEFVKQSIEELKHRKLLSADEARAMVTQVTGAHGLASVALGKDILDRALAAGFGAADVGMELLDASDGLRLTGALLREQTVKYQVLIEVVRANK